MNPIVCKFLKKHKRSNKYFPLPPVCLNCGFIFNYKTEKEYLKAWKLIKAKERKLINER
jgi:hypothetical protein